MVAGSLTEEFASPVAAGRLWKAGVRDAHVLIPKLLPQAITSVELLEGDGGVGTVKKLNFVEGDYVKDVVDVMDDEKFIFKYSVIEGALLGVKVKSMNFEVVFEATAEGGSVSKLKVEYDTIEGSTGVEEEMEKVKAGVAGMMKAVEGYLLANPEVYV